MSKRVVAIDTARAEVDEVQETLQAAGFAQAGEKSGEVARERLRVLAKPLGKRKQRFDGSERGGSALGVLAELVEEALSGRTTDLDDPDFDHPSVHLRGATFNGAKVLPALLASHLPLDLVIIMLGTNDLKTRFDRSAHRIASAAVSPSTQQRR